MHEYLTDFKKQKENKNLIFRCNQDEPYIIKLGDLKKRQVTRFSYCLY